MIIGGSTTSLLSLLQELDKEKYDIDLVLYRNEGPMIDSIPTGINLLTEACLFKGRKSFFYRIWLLLVSGFLFKALWVSLKYNKRIALNGQIMMDARAEIYSRKIEECYDVAIGYLEGWPNKYLASNKISANKKIGWLHVDYIKTYLNPDLDKKTIKKLDAVVSVSQECEQHNKELFQLECSIYLPNILSSKYVRKRSLLEYPNDGKLQDWNNFGGLRILSVGRINNVHKAFDRIIPAAITLKSLGFKFMWDIIGDGVDMPIMLKAVCDNNLQGFVNFIGSRLNSLCFMRNADFLIQPSRYEGKPMVITEALMLGVVPIVTKYASAEEQIENGVTGLILPNTDESLNDNIIDIINDRNNLCHIKNEIVSRNFDNVSDIKLYEDLIESDYANSK